MNFISFIVDTRQHQTTRGFVHNISVLFPRNTFSTSENHYFTIARLLFTLRARFIFIFVYKWKTYNKSTVDVN